MFNFQNMNDYEFELLCKDVLEDELCINLRTYKKGKDGGIDISCFTNNTITAQAKHYINSTYSSLKLSLTKELDKLKKLNTKKYYIFTSLGLTPSNIKEIYELFSNYMESLENIYDSTRINDILSEQKNIDIVNKHYKLWLNSTNVLELINNRNIFIDTEELMFDIESESRMLVETNGYYDSIKILEKEGLIIIQGDPGVGKTTISKMLLIHYATKGYCVRYASDNSVKDIKKSLSHDSTKKEIILLDDFLGQHYLNLKEEKPNEIRSLTSYVLRNKNKKLILNSRIIILNEALRKNLNFRNFIEDSKIHKYIIDLNKMPLYEKAKIFYNHIYFNKLPVEYFNEIKCNEKYIDIIRHRNYNPRIIEYITKKRNYKQCKPFQYYNYIMSKLENPHDVWEDEFENRICNYDRMFMHTMYSLTDTYIDESVLKTCLNKRIKSEKNYDSTIDMFSECLIRLTDSMVRITEENGKKKIGVINPSINDYIFNSLSSNENEVKNILKNSIYIEQIDRIRKINMQLADNINISKIKNKQFLEMKSIEKNPRFYLLDFIYKNKYKSVILRKEIIEIIADASTYCGIGLSRDICSNFLKSIFSDEELFEFYTLKELIFDFSKMRIVFDELILDDISLFLKIYHDYYNEEEGEWIYELELTIESSLILCIKEDVLDEIENSKCDIVTDIIFEADDGTKREYQNEEGNRLIRDVEEALQDEIENIIDKKKLLLKNTIISTEELEISSEEILKQLDYIDEINNYFIDEPDYDQHDYFSDNNSLEAIYEIFERKYLE